MFGRALESFGLPRSRRQPGGFATLARIIVDQQISTAAAASIWAKLEATVGSVTAGNLRPARTEDLKGAGLSAGKVKTLQALVTALEARNFSFQSLARQSNDEVHATLTQLWGIGQWTADIYLMFGMGRPDVWPVGDLALRTGWQCLSGGRTRIKAESLARKAQAWRPHRSAAAILLWHCLKQSKSNPKKTALP